MGKKLAAWLGLPISWLELAIFSRQAFSKAWLGLSLPIWDFAQRTAWLAKQAKLFSRLGLAWLAILAACSKSILETFKISNLEMSLITH